MRRLAPAAFLLLSPAAALAQDAPRAVPVDPSLRTDPQEDWFQHGRNVYESAKRSAGPAQVELYRRAIEILTRYLGEYGSHPNAEAAWWYLGQSYYAVGEVEDAKRCFHSLLNRFGQGRYAAAAAYTLGADHFNNRKYALAATLFEKLAAIATRPDDRQRGHYYAGRSYELMGRTPQAIASYRQLLGDDAENVYLARGRAALGSLYAREGKLAEALELLRQVVESPAAPADTRGEAALQAGSVAARLNQAELSDRFFNLILSTPGMEGFRGDAQIALMAARFDQKRYREIIDIFRENSPSEDSEREARRLMLAARAYMMLDRNADALPLFRQIERTVPAESPFAFDAAYYRLMGFYRIEGRHVLDQVQAFLQLYQRSHPKDPKIHTALLMKAETLYDDGKPAEAADAYREIDPTLLSDRNRRGFLYQRGRCFADAGDYQAAVSSLTSFVKDFPDDSRLPLALAARGTAYSRLGQTGPALADFNRLVELTEDPALLTLAYLESAAMSKEQNDLEMMVARYLAFLERVPKADDSSVAKASYWTGWGMVKLNRGAEAIPHLIKARQLAADTYEKHAGLLLALAYLADKKPVETAEEVDRAIAGGYAGDLPDQLIRWAADQSFNGGAYSQSARFYDLISDSNNPELTPTEVWRFLGKARVQAGDPAGALIAINHALEAEQDPAWRADGLTDRGRALFNLKRHDEALAAVEEGLELRPEGRIGAALHLLRGDVYLAQGKAEQAVSSYILPVQLMSDDDRVVKPRALHQLVTALEKASKPDDAARYRLQLQQTYPGWTPDSP